MNANISSAVPYADVSAVLRDLSAGIAHIFGDQLVGVYLFGSLSYGDFNLESSDIDLVVILRQPASQNELESLKQLHNEVAKKHPKWANRLECSYTPIDMLASTLPPEQPRPYFGEGSFYDEAQYGNEWIINNYLLYQHGITLLGQDFRELISPIGIAEVQKACIQDLFQEWVPKITDPDWLNNSHYQSYLVLNLCRILYTVKCASVGSKKASAAWVKDHHEEWRNLIETAEDWRYGVEMRRQDEAIDFIRFVARQVSAAPPDI